MLSLSTVTRVAALHGLAVLNRPDGLELLAKWKNGLRGGRGCLLVAGVQCEGVAGAPTAGSLMLFLDCSQHFMERSLVRCELIVPACRCAGDIRDYQDPQRIV